MDIFFSLNSKIGRLPFFLRIFIIWIPSLFFTYSLIGEYNNMNTKRFGGSEKIPNPNKHRVKFKIWIKGGRNLHTRKHPTQRLHISLIIAGGLLFCITLAFPPSLQAAHGEKMGMIESTDNGATWQFKGHADFHASLFNPVDPSALFDKGLLVFYFLDLNSLGTDTSVVYRSVATDSTGLDFSTPTKAFQMPGPFTDPMVVKMQNGKYRMYLMGKYAILSAFSDNGFVFTQDPGERTTAGGVPGALVFPDGKVRLFVCGQGITSLISDNGLDFTQEPGVRIPIPSGADVVADPNPIRIANGTYRMAYKVSPPGQVEVPVLDEVHLAESEDGYSWTPGSASLVLGSVPTMVELPDGRMRIYYVDFRNASAIRQQEEEPSEFRLEQNYPNPCNSSTSISYYLLSRQMTTLKLYDMQGREVADLVHEVKKPGSYTITYSIKNLSNGIYFMQLQVGNNIQTRKCIILK
jgi:hypothetical protein